MAEGHYQVHYNERQMLYNELKKRFQEVPDLVIQTIMLQHDYVREKCIDALGRESNRYMNDPYGRNFTSLQHQFGNVQISSSTDALNQPHSFHSEFRNRSDSMESHGSVSSTSSSHSAKVFPTHPVPNNGMHYGRQRYPREPSSAPVLLPDYEPPYQNMAQPASISSSAYNQTSNSRTGTVPGLRHSHSHSPGVNTGPVYNRPSDMNYPGRMPPNWPYPPQSLPARPGNFQQGFDSSQPYNQGVNSPQRQYPGAYSPSHENKVMNSPSSHLPVSPVTTPPNQQHPTHAVTAHINLHNPSIQIPVSSTSIQYEMNRPPSMQYQGYQTPQGAKVSQYAPSQPQYAVSQEHIISQYPAQLTPWTVNGPQVLPGEAGESGQQEDSQYEEALIRHQQERLQKLVDDLIQSRSSLEVLKTRVGIMEVKCVERLRRRSNSFPSAGDVQKMREENRKLQVEIGVLTSQIDVANNGQTPLGITDPVEEQSFYSHIGKGQEGSIHTPNSSATPTQSPTSSDPRYTNTREAPRRPPPPNFLQTERPSHVASPYMSPQTTPSPKTPPRPPHGVYSSATSNIPLYIPPAIPEMPPVATRDFSRSQNPPLSYQTAVPSPYQVTIPNTPTSSALSLIKQDQGTFTPSMHAINQAITSEIAQQQQGEDDFILVGPLPPPRPPPPRPPSNQLRTPTRAPLASPEEGTGQWEEEEDNWNCSACTFLNHPSLDKCEVCEMPRITGDFSFGPVNR